MSKVLRMELRRDVFYPFMERTPITNLDDWEIVEESIDKTFELFADYINRLMELINNKEYQKQYMPDLYPLEKNIPHYDAYKEGFKNACDVMKFSLRRGIK